MPINDISINIKLLRVNNYRLFVRGQYLCPALYKSKDA